MEEAGLKNIVLEIDKLKQIANIAVNRSDQINQKLGFVEEVDKKIKGLGHLVGEVDQKISTQLQRKAMIDKTEKRLDQLNFIFEDIGIKIQNLQKEEAFVQNLSSDLDALKSSVEKTKNQITGLDSLSNKLAAEESSLKELGVELRNLLSQSENNLHSLREENQSLTSYIEETRTKFGETASQIDQKMEDLQTNKKIFWIEPGINLMKQLNFQII